MIFNTVVAEDLGLVGCNSTAYYTACKINEHRAILAAKWCNALRYYTLQNHNDQQPSKTPKSGLLWNCQK
jgi:hypothetical protein